jgi:hypothetical protein
MIKYPPDLSFIQYSLLDFRDRATESFRTAHYIDPETQKATSFRRQAWDAPWDYVNLKQVDRCELLHEIADMYSCVPPYCLDCWKVVVRPTKFSELIKLRDLMRKMSEKDPECQCKCGIEIRSYVPGLYGGYFYNRGKEKGLERLKQVRHKVHKHVDSKIDVYLKRYCTEFEINFGDTATYEFPEHLRTPIEFVLQSVEKWPVVEISPIMRISVFHKWLKFGWKNGSAQDRKEIEDTYNNGQPLYPKIRRYVE